MNEEKKRNRNERYPGGRTDILLLMESLPADERVAAQGAYERVKGTDAEDALCDVLAARRRTEQRRRSDRRTDRQRRRLVGARVDRATAERCKVAAEGCGLSLNEWTTRALLRMLQDTEPYRAPTWDYSEEDRPYLL